MSPPSESRKFCSLGCAYLSPIRNEATASKLRKDRGTLVCEECGIEFALHTRSGKNRRFCGRSCMGKHIGGKFLRTLPRVSKKRIETVCQQCGKKFESWPSGHRKFCSQKCASIFNVPKMTAYNHANGRYSASNCFSHAKRGPRKDIGITVRSSWEANYARYLNFLIRHEGRIDRWEYEPEVFWFEKIKRGCRSYKPDFKVHYKDGAIEYHEVKGWMYPRAKTALNRMRIYHPKVKMILVDQKSYKAIERQVGAMIPNWEMEYKKVLKQKSPRKKRKPRSSK